MKDISETEVCPREDIAAYVDGELSTEAAASLEEHIDACTACSRSLLAQRQFLNALSASLNDGGEIDLPKGFAEKVVTNAESSVRGLRRPNEILTAASISAALFLFLIFAFSGETSAVLAQAGAAGEKLLVLAAYLLKLVSSAFFAFAVVARSVAVHYGGAELFLAVVGVFTFVLIYLSSRWLLRRSA